VVMSVGVAVIPHAAHANSKVETNGGGTCWRQNLPERNTPLWCPIRWQGQPGGSNGALMNYDFNNHTDDVPQPFGGTPRPDWIYGIENAFNAWSQPAVAVSSPIRWARESASYRMLVGVYAVNDGPDADVADVRLYNSAGQFTESCKVPMEVAYARMYINRNLIDGTPPWFFERLVQHELGHVFGLCHPPSGGVAGDSVMINPHPAAIPGCTWSSTPDGDLKPPDGGHFSYSTCYNRPSSPLEAGTAWGANPPSKLDFGSATCNDGFSITGVKCIYNK
jgi:hypothetical protein